MDVSGLLKKELVVYGLAVATVPQAICALVDLAALHGYVNNPDSVKKSLCDREIARHTCVSYDIAVPRTADRGVRRPCILAARLLSPVRCTTGSQLISFVVVYLSTSPKNVAYLKTLVSVAQSLGVAENRVSLIRSSSCDDLYRGLNEVLSRADYRRA